MSKYKVSELRGLQPDEAPTPRPFKKSKKGKKPWVILWMLPEEDNIFRPFGWTVFKRFATKKARDQAWQTLLKKREGGDPLYTMYQFKTGRDG